MKVRVTMFEEPVEVNEAERLDLERQGLLVEEAPEKKVEPAEGETVKKEG